MKELIVPAQTSRLSQVVSFVDDALKECACDKGFRNQVHVAVEEIFVNISSYAYQTDSGDVTIKINVDDHVTIEFYDNGKAYNPLLKEDPDITLAIEERDIGGLGVFLVKKIMDSVEYCYKDNKNVLTIKKQKQ